jgi:hypothetical protein
VDEDHPGREHVVLAVDGQDLRAQDGDALLPFRQRFERPARPD